MPCSVSVVLELPFKSLPRNSLRLLLALPRGSVCLSIYPIWMKQKTWTLTGGTGPPLRPPCPLPSRAAVGTDGTVPPWCDPLTHGGLESARMRPSWMPGPAASMNCHRRGVSVTASGNLCVLCGLLGSELSPSSRPSVSERVEVRLLWTFRAFFTERRAGPRRSPGSILSSRWPASPSSGLPLDAAKVVMRGPRDLVTKAPAPLLVAS